MKRFNIVYLVAIGGIWLLWSMNSQYKYQNVVFFGFAENKETEINLEHPVQIDDIFVTTGQAVTQNTPLMEVSHNKLPLKLSEILHDAEETELKQLLWKGDIESAIDELKAKRAVIVSEINSKIAQIEAEVNQNRFLAGNLESLSPKTGQANAGTTQSRIAALREELRVSVQPLDIEIERLKTKLHKKNNPYQIRLSKLRDAQSFYEDKGRKLYITAPFNGLIGNIHCKKAENVSSFKTLVTFYEENPTLVKGYVHESLLVHVNVGDTLAVSSILHPEVECDGIITGLGSRIIEIPERLRKRPEEKNYGREVLVQIPSDNNFLQKEKVVLKYDIPIEVQTKFFDFILGKPATDKSDRLASDKALKLE